MKPPILDSLVSRLGVIRTRSVLNPVLWLMSVVLVVLVPAAGVAGFTSAVGLVFIAVALLVVLVAVAAYIYFALRDPDRLQSEEFVLKQQELQARAKEGIVIDMRRVRKEANPTAEDHWQHEGE